MSASAPTTPRAGPSGITSGIDDIFSAPRLDLSFSPLEEGMRHHVRTKDVRRTLEEISTELHRSHQGTEELKDKLNQFNLESQGRNARLTADLGRLEHELGARKPQPHIGLGGVHHNPVQAPVSTSGPPGSSLFPRPELREPHVSTQGTYKIYDYQNPPKRSDFLEQALFGSLQVTPRLASQSEWQKMIGYEATPIPPPPSSKTPFNKFVDQRKPVAAFALSAAGPIQGSDEPGMAAVAALNQPIVDLTKKFSVVGH